MKNKKLWYIVLLFSIIVFCTASLFFVKNSYNSKKAATQKSSIKKESTSSINLLSIGDSLAKGTGDSTSRGFSGDYAAALSSKLKRNVVQSSLAESGAASEDLLKIVKDSKNINEFKKADVILISIGGNDLIRLKDINSKDFLKDVQDTEKNYLNNLNNIMSTIRSYNKNCYIVFIGIYNPFPDIIKDEKLTLLNFWNYQTTSVLNHFSKTYYITSSELFNNNIKNYLSQDNFHLNTAGYQLISNKILEKVNNFQ